MDHLNISNQGSNHKSYKGLLRFLGWAFVCLVHSCYTYSLQSRPVNKIHFAASRKRLALIPDVSRSPALSGLHTVPWVQGIPRWKKPSIHAKPLDQSTRRVDYTHMQARTILKTVTEVLDAFGGPSAAAEWAGVGLSAVCNWQARGYIPPGWHYRMHQHFADQKIVLAGSVFGQDDDERPVGRHRMSA